MGLEGLLFIEVFFSVIQVKLERKIAISDFAVVVVEALERELDLESEFMWENFSFPITSCVISGKSFSFSEFPSFCLLK